MVNIEQVRLLEKRVNKAIDYVNRVTNENAVLKSELAQFREENAQIKAECAALRDENTLMSGKLDSCQKRIDELEVLIQRFKEDQARIEEGIVSALNNLNRFEDEVEKTITPSPTPPHAAQPAAHNTPQNPAHIAGSIPPRQPPASAPVAVPAPAAPAAEYHAEAGAPKSVETFDDLTADYAEENDADIDPISDDETLEEITDTFEADDDGGVQAGAPAGAAPGSKELDIF
ncbi:MAG: cell division protein ZapB [Spirochaetaceae bacterium]|jgi:hypothetical protein|nr:cell division protein ZapB [Spirochaetaceae bacterium]